MAPDWAGLAGGVLGSVGNVWTASVQAKAGKDALARQQELQSQAAALSAERLKTYKTIAIIIAVTILIAVTLLLLTKKTA